jgi:pyruvate kinase
MAQSAWHRTKIVCTLGPATDAPGVLARLIDEGMDVARLNMSHGTHDDHARRLKAVREAARESGQPVAVLMDLPGPKFRLGTLPEGARKLEEHAEVMLAADGEGPAVLPVRDPELLGALRPGELVYLADGSVELRVKAIEPGSVRCEVVAGGIVRSGSGINVPESDLPALVPTEEDRRHLAFAAAQGAEWIGVSFVQSAQDLERVRACLQGAVQPLLMAKIEKRRALANLEAIVEAADGVMVARGDLGVETDLAEIPLVQKRIIALANAKARPVVTATQMLESMVEHEHPTRAEVTDVANAVLDGTDAVMLSAESAVGRHPAAAVGMLRRVLTATETEYSARMAREGVGVALPASAGDAVSFAACQLALRLAARAIIAPVRDVETAAAIARFKPQAPLVIVAEDEALARTLAMVRGIAALTSAPLNADACVALARDWLLERSLAERGDAAVLVSSSTAAQGRADTLRTVRLE